MAEARERLLARAATRGEEGLVVTLAMVRQEMSRGAVAAMERKVCKTLCRSLSHCLFLLRVKLGAGG